jgi:hypothetical protein
MAPPPPPPAGQLQVTVRVTVMSAIVVIGGARLHLQSLGPGPGLNVVATLGVAFGGHVGSGIVAKALANAWMQSLVEEEEEALEPLAVCVRLCPQPSAVDVPVPVPPPPVVTETACARLAQSGMSVPMINA